MAMHLTSRLFARRRARGLLLPLLLLAFVLGGSLFAPSAKAATVVLYQNNFESPLVPVTANCGPDLSQQNVNTVWGPEFQQQWTVETLLINGPGHTYTDPTHTGGNYALGMLSTAQNDKLALTIDRQGHPYINLRFDINVFANYAGTGSAGAA